MSTGRVLVIDDDRAFRFAIRKALRRLEYDVSEASNGEDALRELTSSEPPDVALLDLKMDGIGGLEVLRRRGAAPTRVIVLTGHGSVQAAVEAMGLGAFSFLEKPVDAEELAPLLAQAVAETRRARGASEGELVPPLIGRSEAIQQIREFIDRVGPADETVAIYGETGTGKEVVARHIHLASSRSERPFVAMNAACVPKELFESELFGHKRGAFTGATADRLGLFREADGGTLFIDEIAELPPDSQAKLLRATEANAIRPVGESKEVAVDVRIVAATNRDLWREVQEGRFREDLYFRLQVFPVVIPPLRDRRDDVTPLAQHLLGRVGASRLELDEDALHALEAYEWPGNVRELLNVLRRASLFAEGDRIDGDLMRRMIAASVFGRAGMTAGTSTTAKPGAQSPTAAPGGASAEAERAAPSSVSSASSLAEVERAHIEQVLAEMGGNVTRAAAALQIDRRTLQRKLKAYGLSGSDG
ncbi:MAG: sigma-54-dependent transcriptional regulator [Polyangiales bacterium]